ncbi:MAG: nuclear transport factor 2 family protein [Candidatus Zixiibacteriota bacterium]|nr:MAG: nuclear transport factor 2 family protein [candidate division Zixibacteria bacterium]
MRHYVSLIFILLIFISCTAKQEVPGQEAVEQAILAMERQALDRWSAGDPVGFAENAADDITYYDDIAAQTRLDGLEELRSYLTSLEGQIPAHDYELLDTRVQVYGDIAISTLHYQPNVDGEPGPLWKATDVYRFSNGEWRMVHAHWSLVKQE